MSEMFPRTCTDRWPCFAATDRRRNFGTRNASVLLKGNVRCTKKEGRGVPPEPAGHHGCADLLLGEGAALTRQM